MIPIYVFHKAKMAQCGKRGNLKLYKCRFLGKLSQDEIQAMQRLFDEADADKDGMLNL